MAFAQSDYVVGVDLGGTKILTGLADFDGNILAHHKIPTFQDSSEGEHLSMVDRLAESIEKVIDDAGVQKAEIVGVGCTANSPVDHKNGRVMIAPNIPGWRDGYELRAELQKRINLPVTVDNDVNLATLGEATYGAGKGFSDLACIFVGTGIGGGVILDGKLRRGRRWLAGEFGHMIAERNDLVCVCGMTGHFNSYAGGEPIQQRLRQAAEAGESPFLLQCLQENESGKFSGEAILQAISLGDPATLGIINEAQEMLGILIANVVAILDPEAIILGGGVIEGLGDPFIQGIREYVLKNIIFPQALAAPLQIMRAELRPYSVLLGCVALVKDDLLQNP